MEILLEHENLRKNLRGLLVDRIPDSPKNIIRIVWLKVRRIINDLLRVKGLLGTREK